MMRELLETGECRNKADIALRQECTRAHVTQIFYLADLAPEVIDTLVNIETLPFRLSWRWMKEKLRHLPKEDQLAAVLKRGGYMLKALLKALHKKRRA